MIYLHYQASQKKPYAHFRYQKRFYKSLSLRDRRRRFGYYPRFVLHDPIDSAWEKLYRSEHDPSLIQATGLDFSTFRHILLKFAPIYKTHTCYSEDGHIRRKTSKVDRKRSLTPQQHWVLCSCGCECAELTLPALCCLESHSPG